MYGTNMDSIREAGGAATVTLPTPMQFIWPHGGRIVYLTGSFTRWSELVPMSLVEGCPTVFQVIWSLAPGYHQYKFLVDGEWRHDERQPYTNSVCGIVNTIFLGTGSSHVMHSQINSGSNMDVDPKAFRQMVRISEAPSTQMTTEISEDDLCVSRRRLSVYLSTHTVYELLPESGKVVALDVNLPVKQAFHILHAQGIATAPLWDFSKDQFVGVLSALDFILILRELGNHGANLTEEELETHTISAWKEGKAYLNRQVGPYDSMKDLALKILQNGVATVPVLHSSAKDGSFPQLLHLASLSGLLKCEIGESNRQPLAMLRPTASLSAALNLLLQAQVSSIPIVDENDSLLDIYCRSDVTALAKDKVYTHINLSEMTIHQALQLRQDSYSPYEMRSQRCQICLRTDSLHKVMERLANPGVRRLVVVEAGSKRVEGIISLSDIFRFLLG